MIESIMESKTVIAIIIPIVTVLIGSNVFASEFFIGFEMTDKISEKNNHNIITIKNSGWLQAKNVTMYVTFESAVFISDTACLEGTIMQTSDTEINLRFWRMSPNIECKLDMGKTDPTEFSAWIISDDRSVVHYPDSYIISDYLTRLVVYFVGVISVQMMGILIMTHAIYKLILVTLFSYKHKSVDCHKKIKKLIKSTHGARINAYDVSILCAIILSDIHTISEIKTHTSR